MDSGLIAKYPFLSQARELLKSESVNYDELQSAEALVLDALQKRKRETLKSAEEAVKALVLGRLLLACLQNEFVSRKFASGKTEEFIALLKSADESELRSVANDFFPSLENSFDVSLTDFLKAGGKLAEAQLEGGKVFLDRGSLLKLLRSAVFLKMSDFSQVKTRTIPQAIREAAEELGEKIPREPSFAGAFKGKYLQLECVQKILKGVPEGKRYYGSATLAIACVKDKLPREQAAQVMQDYVNNCTRGSQPFTLREALASLDWVYKHPTIGFSCSLNISRGLIESRCKNCVQRGRQK